MRLIAANYGGITLQRINAVRLFLQVFLLSDITTSDGQFIDPCYLYPDRIRSRQSLLLWPQQPLPPISCWKAWRSALNRCYVSTIQLPRTQPAELTHPLGTWRTTTTTQSSQVWSTVYHDGRVLSRQDGAWYHLQAAAVTNHRVIRQHTIVVPAPPPTALPVSLLEINSLTLLQRLPHQQRYAPPVTHVPPPLPTTFAQLLSALPVHEQAVIGHLSMPNDINLFS
jgi:hypothetical protein